MKILGSTLAMRHIALVARRKAQRFALPLVGGLLALSLAACSTSSNSTGDATVGSLTGAETQEQSPGQAKPIAFAPVIGAPATVSSKMNERLTAAAGQSNLPVASSGDAEYTVRGYLVAAAAPKGTKLSYIWDLTDKTGKRAKRFQGDELIEGKKGGDPWALVDDAAIDRIASSTTGKIAAWMSGSEVAAVAPTNSAEASQPEPQQQANVSNNAKSTASVLSAQPVEQPAPEPAAPAAPTEIVAVVQPVIGAPGDGQTSLTAAMRRHLEGAGVKLVEGSSSNAYTVKGTVQMGSADAGQQPITIRWMVVDPAGKTMEKAVVQRNKVPEGSLDGQWGQVADLAASEAARSVAKLIKPTG